VSHVFDGPLADRLLSLQTMTFLKAWTAMVALFGGLMAPGELALAQFSEDPPIEEDVIEGMDTAEAPNAGDAVEDEAVPSLTELASVNSAFQAPSGSSEFNEAKDSTHSPIWLNHYSILYGPSVRNPKSFQPSPKGGPDRERPVLVRNHLTLGYDFSETLLIAGTLPFTWIPVQGHRLEVMDPYVRVGLDHILQNDYLNYYVDLRVHFPVTRESRDQDMLAAFQMFQILTLVPGSNSSLSLDLFGSARTNFFGKQGSGADLELYLAPQLNYQMTSTVALTVLYEMGASHWFGEKPFVFHSDGTDLEPGLSWDVTPKFNLHPYLNIFPSGKVSWDSTSVGLMMNWKML